MKRVLETDIEPTVTAAASAAAAPTTTTPSPSHPPLPSVKLTFLEKAAKSLARLEEKYKFSMAVVGTKGVGKSAFINALLNEGKSETWPLHSAFGAMGVTLNFTYISYAEGDFRASDETKKELFAVKEMMDILKAMKGIRGVVKGKIYLSGPFPGLPPTLTLIDCPGWGDASLVTFHEVLSTMDAVAVHTNRLASDYDLAQSITLAMGGTSPFWRLPPLLFNVHMGEAVTGQVLQDWLGDIHVPITALSVGRKGTKTADLLQCIMDHHETELLQLRTFLRQEYAVLGKVERDRPDWKNEDIKENILLKLRSQFTFLNWKIMESSWPLSHPVDPLSNELVSTLDPEGVYLRCAFALVDLSRRVLEYLFAELKEILPIHHWSRAWRAPQYVLLEEGAKQVAKDWIHERDSGDRNWLTIQKELLPFKEDIRRNLDALLVQMIDELERGMLMGFF